MLQVESLISMRISWYSKCTNCTLFYSTKKLWLGSVVTIYKKDDKKGVIIVIKVRILNFPNPICIHVHYAFFQQI